MDLATCRGGMGDGPVPWTAAMEYARHLRMSRDQRVDFWYLITQMDEFWLDWSAKKRAMKHGGSQNFQASNTEARS